jgi:hypothetical protein
MSELTEKEKADSVAAFAHYLETGSFADIEYFYEPNKQWVQKTRAIFGESEKYRIKPKPTAEDYLKGHEASGLKVGDRVRVLRKAEGYEGGWVGSWVEDMDETVGHQFTVHADYAINGFSFIKDGYEWRFPHFVLEKVEPEYRPFKNAEEFFESGIEWIRENKSFTWRRITKVGDGCAEVEDGIYPFDLLLSDTESRCGKPCGVEITEENK